MNRSWGGSRRLSRRSVVRGGMLGGAGLLGAALVGCGDDEGGTSTPGANGTSAPGGSPAATATQSAPEGGPTRGGVVRGDLITNQDLPNYDLHGASSALVAWSMGLCYDGLVQFDPFESDTVTADLANNWEFTDETTLVFNLNEANFHDGTPFTAEDVVASIERQKNPPEGLVSPRQAQFASIDTVEATDDRTAVFHLNQPSAAILPSLAVPYVAMYSKANVDEGVAYHQENINGTGPWLLDRYDRGALLSFKRNPEYFAEGDLPYMDGIEYYIIPEAVTRFASFRSGDLDMLGPAATDVAAIESEMEDVTLLSTAGTAYYATTVATFKEPWTDERTWRAVALAISKQDANQVISAGRGFVGNPLTGSKWALPEEELLKIPGYKGLGDGAESDMEARWTEARALFDAAGVAEGTEVAVHGRDVFEPWATVFADGLTNAGLVPTLSLYERGQYDELLAAKDYGDMAANSRGSGFADPTPVYADSYLETSGRHYTGLVLPEVEDLFRQQDAALDPEERMELATQMQLAYLGAYPAEIAAFTETRYALRDYVKDYGNLYGSIHVSRKLQWMWLDK